MDVSFPALGRLGRLGNQLFQIASTIGIANKLGMNAVLPQGWEYRRFFNVPDHHFKNPLFVRQYNEPAFEYRLPDNIGKPIALHGYFQSPKYWEGMEAEIKQYLTPNGCNPGSVDAVAIHFRRGDYVGNPNYVNLLHDYYLSSYDKHFKGLPIKVFTDDPAYAKAVMSAGYDSAIRGSEITDFTEMCECKYHICSNSTFSWWAAYISGGSVIRPHQYFDGLLKGNSTDDFWPDTWKIGIDKPVKIDASIIIPVQYDHSDRAENIDAVLSYLRKYFDCEIIIGEIGTSKFSDHAIKYNSKYIHYDWPVFHRTRALNEMTRAASNEIVFNYDADVFVSPWQICQAVTRLHDGVDVVYPYDGTFYWCPRSVLSIINSTKDVGNLSKFKFRSVGATGNDSNSYGGIVGYNRESFFAVGGENENYRSYGNEDFERWTRFNKLGLSVQRIAGPLYHVDHWRGENSSERHKHGFENKKYWLKVQAMDAEQLRNHVNTWTWAK